MESLSLVPQEYNELQLISPTSPQAAGLTILGSPVGSNEFTETSLNAKLEALEADVSLLNLLDHPQLQWTLLYWCIRPKIAHLQRTIRPEICLRLSANFDIIQRRAMELIIKTSFDTRTLEQMVMPISAGGFGLSNTQQTCHAAYTASVLQSLASMESIFPHIRDYCQIEEPDNAWIQHLHDASDDLSAIQPSFLLADAVQPEYSNSGKLQETFTEWVHQEASSRFARSTRKLAPEHQARIHSCAGQYAGAFLRAIPHRTSTLMTPGEFQAACLFRLGMNLPFIPAHLRCDCKRHPLVGNLGEHFHVCAKGNERQSKHNDLVISIRHLCTMAGIETRLEPRGCFPMHTQELRPDLLLINPNLSSLAPPGRDIALDVTITHPGTDTNLRGCSSAKKPGISAVMAEQRKLALYDLTAAQHNIKFFPLVFETYGLLGDQLSTFLDELLHAVYLKSDGHIPKPTLKDYWYKRISVTLQRGNAKMFIARTDRIRNKSIPNFHPQDILEELDDDIPYTPFLCQHPLPAITASLLSSA
jgi:hypothetical protein